MNLRKFWAVGSEEGRAPGAPLKSATGHLYSDLHLVFFNGFQSTFNCKVTGVLPWQQKTKLLVNYDTDCLYAVNNNLKLNTI